MGNRGNAVNETFFSKGHEIRTPAGELFATITRDVHEGDEIAPTDVLYVDGSRPVFGQAIDEPIISAIQRRVDELSEAKNKAA
jgi:hypothetical protein